MRKTSFPIRRLKWAPLILFLFTLIIFMVYGCSHQEPQLIVSQYRFTFDNQTFRIRSISSKDKSESYNELIGERFVAADYDQDRIIDKILLGDVSLIVAQKIYDYGLNEVAKEDKLKVKDRYTDRYVYANDNIQLEIRSYRPANAQPFNEFKITDKRSIISPEINMFIDQNADGILDKVLKGSIDLEKAQAQYAQAIEVGLRKEELIKVNEKILVKEK